MTLESLQEKITRREKERASGSYKVDGWDKGPTGKKYSVGKKVYLLKTPHSVAEISAKILMGRIWDKFNRKCSMPQEVQEVGEVDA